ncbi:MAG: ABC transporter substrate-binding protein [Microcella sp.]
MFTRTRTRRRTAVVVSAFAAIALAACSSTAVEAPSEEETEDALSAPTTLTLWTWVPGIEAQVALFEEAYPNITVNLENVGQGGEHYTKVRTALEAGTGAPDVIHMEYQFISSFRVTDSLLDLSPYGARDLEPDFTPWVWGQVADDAGVWAIPMDAGPMGNLYREDILAEAGITAAPETWDDFAAAAEAVREQTGSYLTNLPSNEGGAFVGLLWQAGAKPFGYDGAETVTINIDSPESQQVVDYWQDLIDRDLVAVDPNFTDTWYQGLANGTYASWQTAAWGPLFLSGTAADTSGLWRAAPLPQWDAANPASGNWGGSSYAVVNTTENPIAAAELAKWINTDPESTLLLATDQFLFPTLQSVLADDAFAGQELEFYGGQQVNALFAEISETIDTEFEWLPFMDFVYTAFPETLGAEIADRGDLRAGLTAWQDAVVEYALSQGFTVAD